MFDPGTFGDTLACKNLARILSEPENKKHARKVSRLLVKYNSCLAKVKQIPITSRDDKCIVRGLIKCIFAHYKDGINALELPAKVKSFSLNILTYYFRITYETI